MSSGAGLLPPTLTESAHKCRQATGKRANITDCMWERGWVRNECGGSRAYRIVILVLWAYSPSTRTNNIYASATASNRKPAQTG